MLNQNSDEQLHQDFLNEFKQLLEKYGSTFEVCDIGTEYYSNRVPCVQFSSQRDESGSMVRDFSQLELPDYITPNYRK